MSISFSGLASGLDTSSWVESLVALKKAKVTTLEEEKKEVQSLQETLSQIKSFFSSFRSMLEKVTDAKFGVASMDLFAQNLATSSNLEALTASATTEAEEATYNVLVDKLASETKANSNYSYMTTIVQTTTATGDSKLINLGVKAGSIGITVNGVEHGVNITENDTLSTFIEKLKKIGVNANFNEESGIFSIDVGEDAINDIGNTNIKEALHLNGVNEGYASDSLLTSKTDTIYSAATRETLLSELGVKSGNVTVSANGQNNTIAIGDTTQLGDFIDILRGYNIDATLDKDGIFTISDAEITNEGTTDILNALGLNSSIYGKSQVTGNLTYKTTITQTTLATSDTLLKNLEGGENIKDGDTVVVKNSNNEYKTITITNASEATLGTLVEGLENAGLYAAMTKDGTVEITGGTITGGSLKIEDILGLQKEPYTAIVTGKPLTETVETHKIVDLQTKLVDDLGVLEGYLEVTDADGNKFYEKIHSGQTIADFMTDMGNLGINTKLDESTGILTITGGAFKTLSDADVQALVANATIVEPDTRYRKGTNLLTCLYGADTISTDQISVASTYSKTKALRYTVTNTVDATKNTTLENLGLSGTGTAIFDVRGENRTITVTQSTTIEGLMDALKDVGIGSGFDEDNSRITIENATLVGGTSNLSDVLDLTTSISGKYVTSSGLYSVDTLRVDATRNTLLKNYGITNSLSEAERTVTIYNSDGSVAATTIVGEGTTVGNLLDFINGQSGKSAVLEYGFLTINNGYIGNAILENSMGLTTTNKSSYALGSVMTVTTNAAVTGETTLGDIISTLGTSDKVQSGYTLEFNSQTISVTASTTLNELINLIYENGGTASLDNTGRLSVNGGTLTGNVAEALGMTSYTHTSSVSSTGEKLYIKDNVYANRDTTLKDLGVTGETSYTIYNSLGQATTTVNLSNTATIGDFLDGLKANGIDGVIANGVIKLDSKEGNYVQGTLATTLGLTTQTVTEIVNTTQKSTVGITHTVSVFADKNTKVLDIIPNANEYEMEIHNSFGEIIGTYSLPANGYEDYTIGDVFWDLENVYGIKCSIKDGVISLNSTNGNYVTGDLAEAFGFSTIEIDNGTTTVGTTVTSTIAITYTKLENANEDTMVYEPRGGSGRTEMTIADKNGNVFWTIIVNETTTFGSLFRQLNVFDIDVDFHDGQIKLSSPSGNIVQGELADILGIATETITTTKTVGATTSSTMKVTYTSTITASLDSSLGSILGPVIDGTISAEGVTGTVVGISTAEDLEYIARLSRYDEFVGKTFVLTDDIDMSSVTDWIGIVGFKGTFDGQGHTISNLNVSTSERFVGLFLSTANATIKNVCLDNFNFQIEQSQSDEYYFAGALVALAQGTNNEISNVNVKNFNMTLNDDKLSAMCSGGIVGRFYGGTISNCTTSGTMTGCLVGQFGGVCGGFSNGTFSKSKSNMIITNTSDNGTILGGLIGYVDLSNSGEKVTVLDCLFNGSLNNLYCGGIVGNTYTYSANNDVTLNLNNCIVKDTSVTGFIYGLIPGFNNNTGSISNTKVNIINCFGNLKNDKIIVETNDAQVNNYGSKSGNYTDAELLNFAKSAKYDTSIWNLDTLDMKRATSSPYVLEVFDANNGGTLFSTTLNSDSTIQNLISALRPYGTVSFSDGVLTFEGDNGEYLVGSLAEALGITTTTNVTHTTLGHVVTSTAAITYTETVVADKSTKLSNLDVPQIDGTITAEGVTGTVIGISTAEDLVNLQNISNNKGLQGGTTFVLMNDIDMSGVTDWEGIYLYDEAHGLNYDAINFDGHGYTISNLNINHDSSVTTNNSVGLFSIIANANVKNLTLKDFTFNVENSSSNKNALVGALAARASDFAVLENIKVENFNVTADCKNLFAGGLVGQLAATKAKNCSTSGSITHVSGNGYSAGFVAQAFYTQTELSNCYSDMTITSCSGSGGFVALQQFGSDSVDYDDKCYVNYSNNIFNGKIINNSGNADASGGLIGTVFNGRYYDETEPYTKETYLTLKNNIFYDNGSQNINTAIIGTINNLNASSTSSYSNLHIALENCFSNYTGNVTYTSSYLYDNGIDYTTTNCHTNLSQEQITEERQKAGFDISSISPDGYIQKSRYSIDIYDPTTGKRTLNTTLSADATVKDALDVLRLYGTVSFENGILNFEGYNGTVLGGGIADLFGIKVESYVASGDDSLTVSYRNTSGTTKYQTVTSKLASTDVTLKQIGFEGKTTIVVGNTDGEYQITIKDTETIDDVFTKLAAFDISGAIDSGGKIILTPTGSSYIKEFEDGDKIFKINTDAENLYWSEDVYDNSKSTSTVLMEKTVDNLTTSTKLSQLGLSSHYTIGLLSNNKAYEVDIYADDTIDDMLTTLAGFGISGQVIDGRLVLTGTENAYIEGMSFDLASALNIEWGENLTYTKITQNTLANTISEDLLCAVDYNLTTSTKFSDITNDNDLTISLTHDGNNVTITFSPDDTVDDMLTTLAGYGIAGQVVDGKVSLSGNKHSYINSISDPLKAALIFGDDVSYSTVIEESTIINSDSEELWENRDDVILTGDSALSTISGLRGGSLLVHKTDGTFVTISVDASKTLDEFFEQISQYGLIGSIDSEGKVTITGVGNVYLQDTGSRGSNILRALRLSNVVTNVKTVTVNRTSDTLSYTATVAATSTTTLENLLDKNGIGITFTGDNAELILHTYSDAGNQFVTLNFSKTQSIYDVIDTLQSYGIQATLDSSGRFSVTSSTLTDFDMTGVLGDFLMGAYTKEFGKDTINNVSTLLVQRTLDKMTDASSLRNFGITGGNILINQDGTHYTVEVDMTKIDTIGDFRNLLSRYGFNSYIDDMGRLNVIGVGNSTLEEIDGGSNILDRLGLTAWTLGEITQQSGHLSEITLETRKISMNDKLKDITDATGANLGITSGQIYVYRDGTRSALNIDTNDTLETLAAKLSQYGISVGISQDGKLYFDGNNDSYMTTDGLITANASNILEKFDISGNWSTRYDSTSKNLSYTENENVKANGSTKLKDLKDTNGNNLGITTGSFYVYNSGVRNTETISDDTTIDDLKATLAKYGLIADFDENGAMSVGAYNNTYLATSALASDNSNIVNTLFEQWNFVNIYTSNNLDIPADEIRAITRDTKLADINEGTYQAGFITVVKDGVKTNISLTADDTVGTLMDELALYGFESVINDKGQLMIKNTGDSLLQKYTGASTASNALELLGIDLNNWINTNTYDSKTLDVTQTTTSEVAATRDTLLSELGVSTGEYYIYNNGVKYTALISSDETLGSFMDTLKSFGIETSLVQGNDGSVLTIVGKGDSYVKKSTNSTNVSNVVEKLFTGNSKSTFEYKGLEQTSTTTVTTNAITEDTLVSYFDKPWGNDTLKSAGTLAVVVNGQTNIISVTDNDTFGSLLEKFRDLGLEATLSKDGQIMIQSGYDTMTIKSDGTTSNLLTNISLNYKDDLGGYSASSVTVNSTTTNIEEKTLSVANYANGSTKMSMLNITDGSLTVYDEGRKATIEIKADETFDQLRTRLATAFADLDLTFENGYLKIYSKDGKNVEVGSTTDKGNFGAITGIASDGNGASVSSRELYCVNGDTAITTSGIFRRGNVTEGTFTIGNAVFNIDSTTTLSNLINQINSSEAANATAFWDNVDGKFVIKSRTTGAALVNIEAGTSNFTDILGFTTTSTVDTTDKDGNAIKTQVSKMNINTQEIGDNAKVKINGTTYTSTSNNIGSDVTRIKGLTINLKGLTKDSAVTLKVERDKETLANAVSGVVDSYNELMKNVDEAIASDGDLKNESTLKLIRNQLRNLMTSSDSGTTVFRNLDSIGIGVAAASGSNISTTNSAIVSMTFDKDKFLKAYEADQDAVKDLIIGGANNKGIFTKVEDLVESTLKSVSGYFASTETSYSNKIKDLDKKITKANKEVDRYKTRLEAKFKSMDMLIAQMQQQYSSFLTT